MTQFQPPPTVPDGSPSAGPPPGGQEYMPSGTQASPSGGPPPPWSAAAIAGFVLSLLGCAGITALAGLILGVVGILKTRGGQRRGRGLAVAAIPISLVTGGLSVLLGMSVIVIARGKVVVDQLPTVLTADSTATAEAVSALRAITSQDFNADVTAEALQDWLKEVGARHGRLVEVPTLSPVQPTAPASGAKAMNFDGKFVSGPASITLTFKREGWNVKIDDLAVDGVSPHD